LLPDLKLKERAADRLDEVLREAPKKSGQDSGQTDQPLLIRRNRRIRSRMW
jgi:hypothetical protein